MTSIAMAGVLAVRSEVELTPGPSPWSALTAGPHPSAASAASENERRGRLRVFTIAPRDRPVRIQDEPGSRSNGSEISLRIWQSDSVAHVEQEIRRAWTYVGVPELRSAYDPPFED